MRYFAIIAIAIIEMVLASCSIKEEQVILEKPTSIKLAFEATNEGEPSTKTAVQSNGTSVWWSAHEDINIFFGDSESSRFTSTNDEPVAKAQFTGSISAITGEVDGSEANYFWGVYPYNALNTCDGTSITATLSGEQTASAGTFADNQWMTVARSQGLALSFRAVCAGFRFSVTKSGVKSVTFRGNNNEVLAGKARIGMDSNGLPIVLENLTEVKEITLSAPNDKTLDVGTMYYMTFYPTNFTDGFTVTFNTETETATRVYSTPKNFARTQVHIGTNFDSAITYTLLHPNNEIWYTTQNGSVYPVTSWDGLVSNTYTDGKGVIVFENDVTEIPYGKFDNRGNGGSKPKITSITLPASVRTIRRAAFGDQCITELTIPTGCSCEEGAFGLMDRLQRIIGDNASADGRLLIENNVVILYAGYGLSSYNIPVGVTKIGEGAFSGQLSLTSISMPNTISTLGNGAFSLCNNLTNISFSYQITTIPSSCFYTMSKVVTSIELPSNLTRIEDYGFTNLRLEALTIPAGVTYIGSGVTFSVSSTSTMFVRVLAATPPTLVEEHAFGEYGVYGFATRIKVPAESVNLYKTDPKWSKYYIEADD